MTGFRMIMCAPNGARRTKDDHEAVPISIEETIETCISAVAAGANALHLHVRDENGNHVLDAGRYKELLQGLQERVPHIPCQITTEAVGIYSPQEQADVVVAVMPEAVSVSIAEMSQDTDVAKRFYAFAAEADIAVQHILYSPQDLLDLAGLQADGIVPNGYGSHLFVLGRYSEGQQSSPRDLLDFLEVKLEGRRLADTAPFMVCAFGQGETACLAAAMTLGGHARVGFENSMWHANGRVARDNAERVASVAEIRQRLGFDVQPDRDAVLALLGRP